MYKWQTDSTHPSTAVFLPVYQDVWDLLLLHLTHSSSPPVQCQYLNCLYLLFLAVSPTKDFVWSIPALLFHHLSFKNIFHGIPRAAHSLLHGYIFLEYQFLSMFRNQVWKTRHKLYFTCKLKEWLCLCYVIQGISRNGCVYGWYPQFPWVDILKNWVLGSLIVPSLAFLSVSPRDISQNCRASHKYIGITQALGSSLRPSIKFNSSATVGSQVLALRREFRGFVEWTTSVYIDAR